MSGNFHTFAIIFNKICIYMKKFFISLAILGSAAGASAQQISEVNRNVENGLIIDAGIGVGSVYSDSKAMFTQRVGAEWNILPEFLADGVSLAVGFYINNSYGGGRDVRTIGTYSYDYTLYSKSDRLGTTSTKQHREGYGTADVNMRRDDISLLPTVSLRYRCTDNLEAYLSFGLGMSIMNGVTGGYSNPDGFSSADVVNKSDYGAVALTYKYNDLDHVKWANGNWTKASFAVSTYIGARYFFTENWGVNAQIGLIAANVRKSYGNSYNVFSVGASYRF